MLIEIQVSRPNCANLIKGVHFDKWFTRHANVSTEHFTQEPHCNRLNVLMGRTIYSGYRRGQNRK